MLCSQAVLGLWATAELQFQPRKRRRSSPASPNPDKGCGWRSMSEDRAFPKALAFCSARQPSALEGVAALEGAHVDVNQTLWLGSLVVSQAGCFS